MSSDVQGRQGGRSWAQIGIGMPSQFRCDDCRLNRPTLGRKKTRTGWRCVGCAQARAAKGVA